jgi:hypothetical protein
MGTSLNPRTGSFDHKLFCEARPGLILWGIGNCSIAAKQYELHGSITRVLRERRDHAMCAAKYGNDWREYTRRVPWRIVPKIY